MGKLFPPIEYPYTFTTLMKNVKVSFYFETGLCLSKQSNVKNVVLLQRDSEISVAIMNFFFLKKPKQKKRD